jgi:hypothetical protein
VARRFSWAEPFHHEAYRCDLQRQVRAWHIRSRSRIDRSAVPSRNEEYVRRQIRSIKQIRYCFSSVFGQWRGRYVRLGSCRISGYTNGHPRMKGYSCAMAPRHFSASLKCCHSSIPAAGRPR